MDKLTIALALQSAKLAGEIAAMEVWARDGRKDGGSCGGSILEFDARTKVAKVAEEIGLVRKSGNDCFLTLAVPAGIASQNAAIPQAQFAAFRKSLDAFGLGKSVKRAWDYCD